MICEVASGITASFWEDSWTGLGPLIDVIGDSGPRTTGLQRDATVSEALVNGSWWLSNSRSRNSIILLFKECLPDPLPISISEMDDEYRWKIGDQPPKLTFSFSATWEYLYCNIPDVDWHQSVWFKGAVQKHAFIAWLVRLHRLSTNDRMYSWIPQISLQCVLCTGHNETHQHFFFDCAYAKQVWSFFSTKLHLVSLIILDEAYSWLKAPSRDKNIILIAKLAFQASIYSIWKERNARLHSNATCPVTSLVAEIKLIIRAKLSILSRLQQKTP